MTLCIAAICQDGSKTAIVTSQDWKVEAGHCSSENMDKCRAVGDDGWVALLAGPIHQADELTRLYQQHLAAPGAYVPLNEYDVLEWLKIPFGKYKRQLADEFLRSSHGFTFDWLEEHGCSHLPEDFFRARLADIGNIKIEAELILAGLLADIPILATIDGQYGVRMEQNFSAIGSGANVAQSMLSYRQQDLFTSLEETIYNVYEAQTMGAIIAPGVGSDLAIRIMVEGKTPRRLTDDGFLKAAEYLKELGPKPADAVEFKFDKTCFERDY